VVSRLSYFMVCVGSFIPLLSVRPNGGSFEGRSLNSWGTTSLHWYQSLGFHLGSFI